ncbi:B12-binding domain-containing radical SAM protein [Pararhizobium antarcticum]|uniref:Radical SAM protein n=1 Tax=Pararhizobium antarcticum TaxID=1798805 RepID=A0A657LZM7_9HYPH|nr:radical SAM protein [Pararhizobium antarcticum]OJF98482.1 radical SAM protein [Rhizobium sp. 58]OJG00986.1 radical SAM protein [Pararhizobium antarcticum]
MRKLLFVIPPYFNAADYLDKARAAVLPAFTIPYGILSMEAYLTAHCKNLAELRLVDLNVTLKRLVEERSVEDYEQIFSAELHAILEEFQPDIVGVSALFNSSFGYIQSLVKTAKDFDRKIITIAGGGLPSAAFKLMLEKCPDLDAICKGEGELPLQELIDSEDPATVIASHKSWINRAGAEKGKMPAHTFIANLDDIPQMNYAMVNLDNYNNRGIDKRYTDQPKREMAIHTSRGCPFLCVFCSNPSLHGRDVRFMSIDRIIEDVTRMRDEFGMTVLMVEDDHFFHDKERAKRLLAELADLGIRCEFPNGVAVYAIDEEVAELFSRAGVSAVALAVESGSDHVLNNIIKKPLKKKLIRPAVEALRKFNVRSHVFIVTGLPGEQDEHRQETLEMLIDHGFDWVHVYLAIPIFGSRLYDICVENGYIENTSNEDFVATKSVIRAPGVDPVKLEAYAYETQLRVNFIENYNMKIGRYDVAIHYMKNVVAKYPDHAFGHLYMSKCYEGMGDLQLAMSHAASALDVFERDAFWKNLAERYDVDYRAMLTLAPLVTKPEGLAISA